MDEIKMINRSKSKEIVVKPSIENVDPFKNYQFQTPKFYSLQENPILYGGNRNWTLNIANSNTDSNTDSNEIECDIFILNTSFIIWFNELNKGIELIYQDIILHAIQEQVVLYLQIEFNNEMREIFKSLQLFKFDLNDLNDFVELNFKRNSNKDKDKDNQNENESLFTICNFGSEIIDNPVQSAYDALSKCTALHIDSAADSDCDLICQEDLFDHDLESQYESAGPSLDQLKYHLQNYGQADDISDISDIEDVNLSNITDIDDIHNIKSALDVEIGSSDNARVRARNSSSPRDNAKRVKKTKIT